MEGLGIEVNSIIDNICTKLGTTAQQLLPELAKYQTYKGIAGMIISGGIALVCAILMAVIFKISTATDIFDDEMLAIVYIIAVVSLIVATPVFFVCLYKYIIWSNAPIGATVTYILEQLN